jgi:hypothetical protein
MLSEIRCPPGAWNELLSQKLYEPFGINGRKDAPRGD